MSHRLKVSEGDWICANKDCGNINFSRRSNCNKCGQAKDVKSQVIKQTGAEIGKGLASKSKGLFSADDWQCGKCGNINWARRVTCNICNTAKFGAEEARTGLGGGYNERQNVEYIEREESDGEYDEFGRKKKKYRDHTTVEPYPGQEEEVEAVQAKYDLEEEEEEDDEEVDLSKYDLSGSEEELERNAMKESLKRQRSRSRSTSASPKRKRSRSISSSSSTSSSSSSSSRSSKSSSSSSSSRSRSASKSPPRASKSRSRSPRNRANSKQS